MDAAAIVVNDVHSRLNATRVRAILTPASIDELVERFKALRDAGRGLAVSGGRHAMGGQQFADGETLLDMRGLDRLITFDAERGLAEFEAGVMWPRVIEQIHERSQHWAIRQKQTGADDLTLGGAVSSNVHGRGLLMGPIGEDIERLRLLTAGGELVDCSRMQNSELFSLVIGGYGLFGVVVTVTLRLSPRQKLRRRVGVLDVDDALVAVRRRVADGCIYGDFQYAIDPTDDTFLRRGVFACYAPAGDTTDEPDGSADLKADDWGKLIGLAHTDKRLAFDTYARHYLATHGRVYWSDTMQLSTYIPSYDQFIRDDSPHSLVIGELYIPPDDLPAFLADARRVLRERQTEDIYGTIRSIRPDTTSFLAWAKRDYACVIFNLRTAHTADGVARTTDTFRRLIDAALGFGGSFFLTYSRAATAGQIERAYPQFEEFLRKKRAYDPAGVITSDWHRHYAAAFA